MKILKGDKYGFNNIEEAAKILILRNQTIKTKVQG
jgi:hypothetical protein